MLSQQKNNKFISSLKIPNSPGIYKMYSEDGVLLYIGKAKNLHKRVSSYFSLSKNQDLKTKYLVAQISKIDFIVTASEKEALILEQQLIKINKPKYNILLKDDKSYPYIKITKEAFPKIEIVRDRNDKNALYFGPFPLIGNTRQLKNFFQEIFHLRSCKQEISLLDKNKSCILLDLQQCLGPCINKQVKTEYDQAIHNFILFLKGKNKRLINFFTQKMQFYSQNLEFESAGKIRDILYKLKIITEKQTVSLNSKKNLDVWAFIQNSNYYYLIIQQIREGRLLVQKGYYVTKINTDVQNFLETIFQENYEQKKKTPDLILISEELSSIVENIINFIKNNNFKTEIKFPLTGENKTILEKAEYNAKIGLARIGVFPENFKQPKIDVLKELQNKLCLKKYPYDIIAIDVSHLNSTDIVGTAIYFENGFKKTNKYRRYNIKLVTQKSNDPLAVYEVCIRRIKELQKKFNKKHFLFIIDGGKAQLKFAQRAFMDANFFNYDLISIAKKEEEIFISFQKQSIKLAEQDEVLLFIRKIRDEVHRYTVSFQRQKRKDFFKRSILAKIDGLGEIRINRLVAKFGNINEIKNSKVEDIAKTAKIGLSLAEEIKKRLINEK